MPRFFLITRLIEALNSLSIINKNKNHFFDDFFSNIKTKRSFVARIIKTKLHGIYFVFD